MIIPAQLQNRNFRFILLGKKSKIPIEKDWQKHNNYEFDNPKLLEHLLRGNNYGVLGGMGNLIILDFDNLDLQNVIMPKLPQTFTVKSGGTLGGLHLYYICDEAESFKVLDKDLSTLADIQGVGKYIVGPSSIHPDTDNDYTVITDMPIQTISLGELKAILGPWLLDEKADEIVIKKPNKLTTKIKDALKISTYLKSININSDKSPTSCPFHESRGGRCFSFSDEKQVWHCFHCQKKGDLIALYMLKNECEFKDAIKNLATLTNLEDDYEKTVKKKHEDKGDEPKMISVIVDGNILVDEVFKNGHAQFVVYDGNDISYVDSYTRGGQKFIPLYDNTITEGAVILPEKAEEYESTVKLLQDIREYIKKFLDMTDDMVNISAWYCLLSWVYDTLRTVPYLRARGDTGSGKTRFLDTIGHITYHSVKASGCVTPAPIYRLIRLWRGTLLLDEADFSASDENNEVVKILNCGYQKNTPVIRCNKNDPDKLEILPTFGPKVIATRQSFKDKALESRCLTEIMRKTSRRDIPVDLTEEFFNLSRTLRNQLLMWRLTNYFKIDPYKGIDIEYNIDVEPRIKQSVVSFPSIFLNDEEALTEFKEYVLFHQKEVIDERGDSFDGILVNTLAELILDKIEAKLQTQTSIDDTKDILNDTYITAREISDKMAFGDKRIDPGIIGRHLKSLKIPTQKLIRIDGKVVRPIDLSDRKHLLTTFKSYVPDEETIKNLTLHLESSVTKNLDKNQSLMKDYTINDKMGPSSVTDVTLVTDTLSDTQKLLQTPPVVRKQSLSPGAGGEAAGKCVRHASVTSITSVTSPGQDWVEYLIPNNEEIDILRLLDLGILQEDINKKLEIGEIYESKPGFVRKL